MSLSSFESDTPIADWLPGWFSGKSPWLVDGGMVMLLWARGMEAALLFMEAWCVLGDVCLPLGFGFYDPGVHSTTQERFVL